MQVKESRFSKEACQTLFDEVTTRYWNLQEKERLIDLTHAHLYDLTHLYIDATDEVKVKIEAEFDKVFGVKSYTESGEVVSKLKNMIPTYNVVSKIAKYSPLCHKLQNHITQTALTLKDWYAVADNEVPNPSLNDELKATTLPGPLKNIALQMILMHGKTLDDTGYVTRNSKPGTPLYIAAQQAGVTMLSSNGSGDAGLYGYTSVFLTGVFLFQMIFLIIFLVFYFSFLLKNGFIKLF